MKFSDKDLNNKLIARENLEVALMLISCCAKYEDIFVRQHARDDRGERN
jgi:hypothetical protein